MNLIINLDKPKGITSQDAVTMVKRLLGLKKVGHCGTLDPMATGVLVICTGEATKVSSMIVDMDKEYSAVMKLGERTDTYDAEGRVIASANPSGITKEAVQEVLARFRGRIKQKPPMYSAIKQAGTPLYKLARKGIDVERPEREIEITGLELESFDPPYAGIRVRCSKGTYIRTLADDIGAALGCFAHLSELRRLRVGRFFSEDSALPGEIALKPSSTCTIAQALIHLQEVTLFGTDLTTVSNGGAVKPSIDAAFSDGELLRLNDPDGLLLGIGIYSSGVIKVQRLLHLGLKP